MGVCLSLKSIKFNVKEESSIMKADETKRKREILLGINPCIYGLNYHDPAVVVLIDGRVVFGVEEERCNRVKHSKGVFPSLALAECLTYCNLTWDDIDAVVIGYEPALWMNRLNLELLDIINPFVSCVSNSIQIRGSEIVEKIIRTNIVDRYTFFRSQENVRKLIIEKCSALETTKVMFCEHHLAHIASSYEVSGFSEAVGIVVDGIGETAVTTLWRIQNHQYEKILQIDYPNSLGYFYAIATKFLGFEPWGGEGKTMALAAYGKKNKEIADRLKSAFTLNGAFYDVSHFMHNHNAGFLMMNEDELIHELEALLGFSAREKDASITDEHIDFAWFVQDYLERSVIRLINYAVQKTGIVNVCAAGGVFMNCKMNMVIRETSEATNFYVQPLWNTTWICWSGRWTARRNVNGGVCRRALPAKERWPASRYAHPAHLRPRWRQSSRMRRMSRFRMTANGQQSPGHTNRRTALWSRCGSSSIRQNPSTGNIPPRYSECWIRA